VSLPTAKEDKRGQRALPLLLLGFQVKIGDEGVEIMNFFFVVLKTFKLKFKS
jgi:hypothetical protein